jgi:hypothetical protein
VRAGTPTPLALLAAAAAAPAAGDEGRAADQTPPGAQQATRAPTYYGDAWVALAAGLADGSLVDC